MQLHSAPLIYQLVKRTTIPSRLQIKQLKVDLNLYMIIQLTQLILNKNKSVDINQEIVRQSQICQIKQLSHNNACIKQISIQVRWEREGCCETDRGEISWICD